MTLPDDEELHSYTCFVIRSVTLTCIAEGIEDLPEELMSSKNFLNSDGSILSFLSASYLKNIKPNGRGRSSWNDQALNDIH